MENGKQMRGLYLEDFEIGKEYISPERTITAEDVDCFARLSGDFNPLHTDEEYAKTTIYGTRIAHGALGFIISTGLSNELGIFEGTTIGFLEGSVKYPAPLKIGAVVHVSLTITEARHTSKPGRGIVRQFVKLINQDGVTVMESDQVIMVKSRV